MTEATPVPAPSAAPEPTPVTVANFPGVPAELRDDLHALLAEIEGKVRQFFGAHNLAKVEQLLAHSATVHMVIDDLHDTTPPAPPTA